MEGAKEERQVFELGPRASGRGAVSEALPLFKRLVNGDDARGGGGNLLAQRPSKVHDYATPGRASHAARQPKDRRGK
ncbi:hypothetical protein MRX96_014907 [Rhipicephalus microplus]